MSARIRVLSTEIANRIAAGEVVERPASIVKELVENALDAGATRLEVQLERGGLDLVQVEDDGSGMGPEDLALSVMPHATSKIADVDDLFRIASFGFRGEALASIASVANLSIRTREPSAEHGHELIARPGEAPVIKPTGTKPGTIVTVRELFFNVPARRHFLKSPRAEFAQVMEALTRALTPRPDVELRVIHDGKLSLELRDSTDQIGRLKALHGKELAGRLKEVKATEGSMRLVAYVSPPDLVRATARLQELWLNGRWIRDRSLLHAFKDAYRGLIMPKDHPIGFLFLDVDPQTIDINVHPMKSEVRFRERDALFSFLRKAVRSTLEGEAAWGGVRLRALEEPPKIDLGQLVRERTGGLFEAQSERVNPSASWGLDQLASMPESDSVLVKEYPLPAPVAAIEPPRRAPRGALSRRCHEFRPRAEREVPAGAASRVFQLHRSYLLVETAAGLRIIDQHALHERKLYEQLLARFRGAPGEDQRLLIPDVLECRPADKVLLLDHADELMRVGLEIVEFGPSAVALHAIPAILASEGAAALLEPILETLREEGQLRESPELLLRMLGNLACRSAVTFNTALDPREIAHLLAWLDDNPQARNCPHGRPIALEVSLEDLEQQFARKK